MLAMTPSSKSSRSRYSCLAVAGRDAGAGEPPREAGFGALAQFARLVDHAVADRKTRQDRLLGVRAEGAALGDLDGRGDRLRQIGEQRAPFRRGS